MSNEQCGQIPPGYWMDGCEWGIVVFGQRYRAGRTIDPSTARQACILHRNSVVESQRAIGPALGRKSRLDVVWVGRRDDGEGLYELRWVEDRANGTLGDEPAISEPMTRADLLSAIIQLSGALRRASAHERDPVKEWANVQRGLSEIEEDYARPDYPRHLLVQEVRELRAQVSTKASPASVWEPSVGDRVLWIDTDEVFKATRVTDHPQYGRVVWGVQDDAGRESFIPLREARPHRIPSWRTYDWRSDDPMVAAEWSTMRGHVRKRLHGPEAFAIEARLTMVEMELRKHTEGQPDLLGALIAQIHRLRRYAGSPGMTHGIQPPDVIMALQDEVKEVQAEPHGSEAARREAAGCLACSAHLIIANGGEVRRWVCDEVERLTRRLDHIEAGGTWESAKQAERVHDEAIAEYNAQVDALTAPHPEAG